MDNCIESNMKFTVHTLNCTPYETMRHPMTYETINIEIEIQYSSFGATKNDLKLIIVF